MTKHLVLVLQRAWAERAKQSSSNTALDHVGVHAVGSREHTPGHGPAYKDIKSPFQASTHSQRGHIRAHRHKAGKCVASSLATDELCYC